MLFLSCALLVSLGGLCGQLEALDGEPEFNQRHRVLGLHELQEVAQTVLVGEDVGKAEE